MLCVGEWSYLMDGGGDNEKWYECKRMSMTEVELWMIEWVGAENEIRFCTSGGVSALRIENLSVLHALMQSSKLLYWSSRNGEGSLSS